MTQCFGPAQELAKIIFEARRKCGWFIFGGSLKLCTVWLANCWENIWEAVANG